MGSDRQNELREKAKAICKAQNKPTSWIGVAPMSALQQCVDSGVAPDVQFSFPEPKKFLYGEDEIELKLSGHIFFMPKSLEVSAPQVLAKSNLDHCENPLGRVNEGIPTFQSV